MNKKTIFGISFTLAILLVILCFGLIIGHSSVRGQSANELQLQGIGVTNGLGNQKEDERNINTIDNNSMGATQNSDVGLTSSSVLANSLGNDGVTMEQLKNYLKGLKIVMETRFANSTPSQTSDSVSISCNQDERLVGGGFSDVKYGKIVWNGPLSEANHDSWLVKASRDDLKVHPTFNAFAVCAKAILHDSCAASVCSGTGEEGQQQLPDTGAAVQGQQGQQLPDTGAAEQGQQPPNIAEDTPGTFNQLPH